MLTWVNKAAANFTKLTTVGASNHSFFSTLVFKIRKMAVVGFVKFNITLENTLNFKKKLLKIRKMAVGFVKFNVTLKIH